MTDILIRPANENDIEPMARWAEAMAWETECKRLNPDAIRRGILAGFKDPERARYYIAQAGDELAGTLMITFEWSDWRCAWWWWIQSVYVAPNHRRKGVYRALHKHVQALAKARDDVCGLRLYVERDNIRAQRTYETLGMRDAGYRMYVTAFDRTKPQP